jgi:hypothetical protein
MKQLINALGVVFLVVSLVVIVVAAVMSFIQEKPSSGTLILQIVISLFAAVIGVVHIVIAAILSKRS